MSRVAIHSPRDFYLGCTFISGYLHREFALGGLQRRLSIIGVSL